MRKLRSLIGGIVWYYEQVRDWVKEEVWIWIANHIKPPKTEPKRKSKKSLDGPDLEIVDSKDLIHELFNRHKLAFFLGIPMAQTGPEDILQVNGCGKGPPQDVLGMLGSFLQATQPPEGFGCESGDDSDEDDE